jgi:hypothetical protein
VIPIPACPSRSWTTLGCTLAASASVAQVCRRPWTVIRGSPARPTCLTNASLNTFPFSGRPSGRQNTRRLVELASPVLANRDDDDFGIQRRMADHCGGFVQLQERKPGGPVTMRTASAFNQDPEASARVDEWAKESRIEVRGYSLVWRWPLGGWDRLDEPRRCARGTRIVAAVPLPGAVVERDGKSWTVVTSPMSRWGPCREWVAADVLGGKQLAAAS